jgi:hypothetical protein
VIGSGAWWLCPAAMLPGKTPDVTRQPIRHIGDGLPSSIIEVNSFVPHLTYEHYTGDIVFSVTC